MLIFRAINASWPRRIQFAAFAVLASAPLLLLQPNNLWAEWFAFKKIPAPTEPAEPQKNEGFDKAIRNLLKEANRLENKGELDQAIHLVERAAKISEESSSLVKISPDLSSSTISAYAKELRAKKEKIELSKKRVKPANPTTTAVASSSQKKESASKDKTNRASRVKPPVAPEHMAIQVREKKQSVADSQFTLPDEPVSAPPKSRRDYASSVALSTTRPIVADLEPAELPSPSKQPLEPTTPTNKVEIVSTPVASADEPPFEPFVDEESAQKDIPQDIRSFSQDAVASKAVVASRDIVHTDEDRALPDQENNKLLPSTSIESEPVTPVHDSRPVKLRSRYQMSEAPPAASDKTTSEHRTSSAEAKVTTASIETDESSIERDIQQVDNSQESDSPVIQVRDLQPAKDDSSTRDQSDISSSLAKLKEESIEVDQQPLPAETKTLSPFRIRRSLKLRNNYSVLPLLTPIVARSTREPVVGHTSMISWRPAKARSSVAANDPISETESKPNESGVEIRRMQSDNDRPIFGHVSTGIRHGFARESEIQTALDETTESSVVSTTSQTDETSSPARREIRGSLWDNAAVPTFEGTWKPAKSQSENERVAPLPPRAKRIEQTAFVHPHDTVKNDLRSDLNRKPTETMEQVSNSARESATALADLEETSGQEQIETSDSRNNEMEWADAIVSHDSNQHSAGNTGLPESTVSTMLGAFGIALLIAGIWMVRATTGIKHA